MEYRRRTKKEQDNLTEFEEKLRALINIHSLEGFSDTPDYTLASYLMSCLHAYEFALQHRS